MTVSRFKVDMSAALQIVCGNGNLRRDGGINVDRIRVGAASDFCGAFYSECTAPRGRRIQPYSCAFSVCGSIVAFYDNVVYGTRAAKDVYAASAAVQPR